MKDNFFIKIESFHSADKGTIDNVILAFNRLFYKIISKFILKKTGF